MFQLYYMFHNNIHNVNKRNFQSEQSYIRKISLIWNYKNRQSSGRIASWIKIKNN